MQGGPLRGHAGGFLVPGLIRYMFRRVCIGGLGLSWLLTFGEASLAVEDERARRAIERACRL